MVAALVLAGCSGSPGPGEQSTTAAGASPSESAAPSVPASPTPSSTLRPLPPEASELSEAGAVAFLEWWVEMYNHVEATGETDLVFQHSEPECTFCRNFVEDVDPVYAAGGRIERESPADFRDPTAEGVDAQGYVIITVEVVGGAGRTYARNGDLIESSPATVAFPAAIGLQWEDSSWRFVDIGFEGEKK